MTGQSPVWAGFPEGGGPPPLANDASPRPLPHKFLARPVLIIEDEAMIAWWLETLLEDLGFTTIGIAATAADAVALAQTLLPGLVVSDINLGAGEEDGIDVVATIAAGGSIATLFVTGHAEDEAMIRIGAVAPLARVLRKPVAATALREAIAEVLIDPRCH